MINTLQTEHTHEVEKHHYVLSVNMIQEISNQTLWIFCQVSEQWHKIVEFENILTVIKSNLCWQRYATSPAKAHFLNCDEDVFLMIKQICSFNWHVISSIKIIDMLAYSIWDFLHCIYSSTVTFKKHKQLWTIQMIIVQKENVIVVLSIGRDKSLTILIFTLLQHNQITLVMIFFLVLQNEMRDHLMSVEIQLNV